MDLRGCGELPAYVVLAANDAAAALCRKARRDSMFIPL
jgi:hypothetical protein